eukprot:5679401-Amphidinium_carterae.1
MSCACQCYTEAVASNTRCVSTRAAAPMSASMQPMTATVDRSYGLLRGVLMNLITWWPCMITPQHRVSSAYVSKTLVAMP